MALIPPQYLKTVVSIEGKDPEGQIVQIGTGFIYADVIKKIGEGQFEVKDYLVTAKHVIYRDGVDHSSQRREIFLRFDSLSGTNPMSYKMDLYRTDGQAIFTFPYGELDVAVIRLNPTDLRDRGLDFVEIISSETDLLPSKFQDEGLSTGDEVFFLGFPLGIRGEERNYAICRSGSIARVDPETLKKHCIYLDGPVFPGNSGGPVFCKPNLTRIEGTKSIRKAFLLGIATKYLYPKDGADASISESDMKHLEGHLGLSKIITVDAIRLAIEEHQRRFTLTTSPGNESITI